MEKVFKTNDLGIKLLSREKPLSIYIAEHDFFINGRIDDIIVMEKDGKTYLVEVKTIKDLYYLNKPKKEHVLQLNFYLKAYPEADGIIFYIEKNTLQTKEFTIKFNQTLFQEMIERAKILHENLKSKTQPDPEGKQKDSWECSFCLYKKECMKD
jgi:CRISPR/Cas system-associated exonuclease Cas4 (RecB family)